jgi:hypothetical protein
MRLNGDSLQAQTLFHVNRKFELYWNSICRRKRSREEVDENEGVDGSRVVKRLKLGEASV